MIEKRVICPDRMRIVPRQFSWIDHALVRKKYICGLSHASLALYSCDGFRRGGTQLLFRFFNQSLFTT